MRDSGARDRARVCVLARRGARGVVRHRSRDGTRLPCVWSHNGRRETRDETSGRQPQAGDRRGGVGAGDIDHTPRCGRGERGAAERSCSIQCAVFFSFIPYSIRFSYYHFCYIGIGYRSINAAYYNTRRLEFVPTSIQKHICAHDPVNVVHGRNDDERNGIKNDAPPDGRPRWSRTRSPPRVSCVDGGAFVSTAAVHAPAAGWRRAVVS